MSTTLKQILVSNPATLRPDNTMMDAAKMMAQNSVGFLPVVDRETVVGVLTDRDLVVKGMAPKRDMNSKIDMIMTKNPATIESNKTMEEASRMMGEKQIRRLVVTENNKFRGVISIGDLALAVHGKGNEKAVNDAFYGICQHRVGAQ